MQCTCDELDISGGIRRSAYCSTKCCERAKYRQSKETGAYARKLAFKVAKYAADEGYRALKLSQTRASYEKRIGRPVRERFSLDGPCLVEGCEKSRNSRGLCSGHYKRARYEAGETWYYATGHRRRAAHYGVEYQQFSDTVIFERDNWTCGICSEPVDREARGADPRMPSIDHIIPMSRGGGHVPSNVQCAHFGCNMKKAATVPVVSMKPLRGLPALSCKNCGVTFERLTMRQAYCAPSCATEAANARRRAKRREAAQWAA